MRKDAFPNNTGNDGLMRGDLVERNGEYYCVMGRFSKGLGKRWWLDFGKGSSGVRLLCKKVLFESEGSWIVQDGQKTILDDSQNFRKC